jgi:glycosyltransferase involved in cell wall biosynthesis
MIKTNAIFLTHPDLLKSTITGGVQLCSQEFHHILEDMEDINLEDYYVGYTRKISQRMLIKTGMENYDGYDVKRDADALSKHIADNRIELVFLNMASTVRYAKVIKEQFGEKVKTILLSHGNYSGDFLHLITKPLKKTGFLQGLRNKIRLGRLVSTEAEQRVRWLDGVVTLSETERQIENWFGAKKTSFLPRRLYKDFLNHQPVKGRVGFVGRLDHPPNLQGVSILLEELNKQPQQLQFRLVGAPLEYGQKIQAQFPFVEYLGELGDDELEKEVATWAFLLNPVWWYATGASTKLARAISWGLPIITTTAGMRGYEWKQGALLVADNPAAMADLLIREANCPDQVTYWGNQTRLIAENGPDQHELANRIRNTFL